MHEAGLAGSERLREDSTHQPWSSRGWSCTGLAPCKLPTPAPDNIIPGAGHWVRFIILCHMTTQLPPPFVPSPSEPKCNGIVNTTSLFFVLKAVLRASKRPGEGHMPCLRASRHWQPGVLERAPALAQGRGQGLGQQRARAKQGLWLCQ